MATKNFIVKYRREREKKTDYGKRLTLLKSGEKRLIVRKSLKNINAQVSDYNCDGDKILASAGKKDLIDKGWKYSYNSTPAAYLIGLSLGIKAKTAKVKKVIVDFGYNKSTKGSKLYALLKGVKDSGIEINVDEKMLPSEDRINGKHITDFAKNVKATGDGNENKQFSKYLKEGNSPENITSAFESIKKKIIGQK